jgi:hypothetical protein
VSIHINIKKVTVIDNIINTSDHRPVSCLLKLSDDLDKPRTPASKKCMRFKTRWDKANLSDYYNTSFNLMQNINTDDCFTTCSLGCDCVSHCAAIDYVV